MTTITYTGNALGSVKHWEKPSEHSAPVVVPDDELSIYLERGWIKVGTASITVEYKRAEELDGQKLDALKQQLQTVRAENWQRENAILNAISKLTAIGYTEAV